MQNHDAQQTETTLADDALADVTGGTSVIPPGYVSAALLAAAEEAQRAARAATAPSPTNNGPIFPDTTFDYPKGPFQDPR